MGEGNRRTGLGETPIIDEAVDALEEIYLLRFYVKHAGVGAGEKMMRVTYVYRNDGSDPRSIVPLMELPRVVQPNLRVQAASGTLLPVLDSQSSRLIHHAYAEKLLDELHERWGEIVGSQVTVLTRGQLAAAMASTTRSEDADQVRRALEDAVKASTARSGS